MNVKKIALVFLLITSLLTASGCCCTGLGTLLKPEKVEENETVSLDVSNTADEESKSSDKQEESDSANDESSQEVSDGSFDESSEEDFDETSQPDVSQPELITPDKSMLQRFNIFLSNFSEQGFAENYVWNESIGDYELSPEEFSASTSDVATMVKFVHLYAKINLDKQKTVVHGGFAYDGVSLYTVNLLTERFFGRTVTASNIPTGEFLQYAGYSLIVIDNMVCTPAADGGTFNVISICRNVYDLGDGKYKVEFDTFIVENENIAPIGGTITDKSVYSLTFEQASARLDFSHRLSGVAVIEPYVDSEGKDRICLNSYQVFDN